MATKDNQTEIKKQLKGFISSSIKSQILNENELHELLNHIQTSDLRQFWEYFSGEMAFTNMNRNVPDWQKKNQLNELKYLTLKYSYSSNENKESQGYREGLINHIKSHLITHVKEEVIIKNEFKNQTFWERVPYFYLLSFLSLIPFAIIFAIINSVFEKTNIVKTVMRTFSLIYAFLFCAVWILYFLSFFFVKKTTSNLEIKQKQ